MNTFYFRKLVLIVIFWRSLFVFLYLFFGHCLVSSSSIWGFWLPLWYRQTLLNKVTWPGHCTITNCIAQYLQTFRNKTKRYFNSTRINFHTKDRICINMKYLFTIHRTLNGNDISVIEDNICNNLPSLQRLWVSFSMTGTNK